MNVSCHVYAYLYIVGTPVKEGEGNIIEEAGIDQVVTFRTGKYSIRNITRETQTTSVSFPNRLIISKCHKFSDVYALGRTE